MLIKGIDFPEELLRAQMAGELVIFAGAGVSNPAPSSLPLFGELATRIGASTGIDREASEPEDRYLGRLKKNGVHVHESAARILVNEQTKPHVLHNLLMQIFPSGDKARVVTTNFDTHFSTTIRECFGENGEIYYAPAVPLGDDFSGLVYLHGCAGKDPRRCILTDEGFGRAYLTQAWASRFLASMFSKYTVLFVGYSHNDTVMNYLARGLPPVGQKRRFAFTTDDKESLAKWEFLGIQPLTYKKHLGENQHEAITESMAEWVAELRRGLLEKAQRIRAIAEAQPPLEGEDSDYIKFSLSELETARVFLKHARLPEWISWLERHKILQPLFDPRTELNEFQRALGFWLIDEFMVAHTQDLMAAIQRNNNRLHPWLCWCIWRRLSIRDRDTSVDTVFSRWVALLTSQPHDVLSNGDWASLLSHCRFADDRIASVILFDLITKPRVVLKERWGLLDELEEQKQKVDCDITLLRDQEHWVSEAWERLLKPNLAAYACDLEPVVTANLAAAHGLMEIFGRARRDYDSFYFHRQSIEAHPQDHFPKVIDVLIDAARDIAGFMLRERPQQGSQLIEKWFGSGAPILRRLAVHGFSKRTDVTADDKLQWLLDNDLLYKFKTDVFLFLRLTYAGASDRVKRDLLDRAMQGPVGELLDGLEDRTRQYETFNLIVWLKRSAPTCVLTDQKLQTLKAENPDYAEREEPELDFTSGAVETIDPTEGFNIDDVASQTPQAFLDTLLAWTPRHPMDRSRADHCSVVAAVVAKKPEWGIHWIQTLVTRGLVDADLWECVCQGWRNATLYPEQWQSVLSLVETVQAPAGFFTAFAEVLEHGSRREQNSLPAEKMEDAQRVAERIWKIALSSDPPDEEDHEDWLAVAINRPGGKLAEFWLQRVSAARKLAGDSWRGLPAGIANGISGMLMGTQGAAAHARVVIASQFHYFFSLDPSFAQARLLPLFNWQNDARRAMQCWHGYLFWGRWLPGFTEQLLPYFNEAINRIAQMPEDVRERVATHIGGIALFRMENPISNGWLTTVLQKLQDQEREKLAWVIDRLLQDTETDAAEKIWERWFKQYWEARLLGTPKPLLPKEANELVFCSLCFGKYFPDAVRLAVSMSGLVRLEHADLIYRIDQKKLTQAFPQSTADLVLFFLRSKPQYFYYSEYVKNVWRELDSSGVNSQTLQDIRNAMFSLGYDPGQV